MAKLGLTKTVIIIILIMSGCSGSEESTVSMEDKVGQLFMIGFQGKTMTSETEALIRTIRPGGVILFGRNIENADQLTKLIQDLQDLSMEVTGLPLLVSTDQEGGEICRIKWLDDNVPEADGLNRSAVALNPLSKKSWPNTPISFQTLPSKFSSCRILPSC